jgi:hypothetical protein
VASVARDKGVTLLNGNTVRPHEIWIISSKPFPEQDRRQVDSILRDMTCENIKIIAADELCQLLVEKLPRLAAKFSQFVDVRAADLIGFLSKHRESRAFGLSQDRPLEEFYVPVTFAPRLRLAYAAFNDMINVDNHIEKRSIPLSELLQLDEIDEDISFIERKLLTRLHDQIPISPAEMHNAKFKITLSEEWQLVITACRDRIKSGLTTEFGGRTKTQQEQDSRSLLEGYEIKYFVTVYLQQALRNEVKKVKKAILQCSKKKEKKARNIIRSYAEVHKLNEYVESLMDKYKVEVEVYDFTKEDIIRIQVQDPLDVLDISDLLMIEGPPGSGKTTFLRILSIRILEEGGKVLYVPCCSVQPKYRNKSLSYIVQNLSEGRVAKKWALKDSILVLDGLDEAPFDLSDKIKREKRRFSKIIVSVRTAYNTEIRGSSFNIGLVPFDESERDEFFEKWFRGDINHKKIVRKLISDFPDIDYHTRLPLLATLTATLIQKGYKPTTRSEIYDNRLRLLLSEWDQFKEIERIHIDDPKAKRRFLRKLAFNVHSSEQRRRTFNSEDIRKAFIGALGDWGYQKGIEFIIDDLIHASGVIIKERRNVYTFGHLSFQEHLAGEYIYEQNYTTQQIEPLMLNDWWREPLLFYASIKGDITYLVRYLSSGEKIFLYADLLTEMIRYAPYTSPGATEMVLNLSKWAKTRDRKI